MPEEREQPDEPAGGLEAPALTEAAREQLERFRAAHQTQVLTILLSDLEGSTSRQDRLGNVRAAELVQTHRGIFRRTLEDFDGEEVETAGDSFLVAFAAPSEGVKFALRMQAEMRKAARNTPQLPAVRVGIHQGQVVVERHADGAKAMDIYGLQVSTTARIADLARGGQILCSRAVFDDARTILRGEDLQGLRPVAWCNHGPYRFKGIEDAYDVCEVGEEGAAPLEAPRAGAKSWPAGQAEEELGWRPARGVTVPGADWILEERLGKEDGDGGRAPRGEAGLARAGAPQKYRGEFGEVWKAWNPTDRSYQVFKFCFKRDRVPALKREARLLKRLRKHRHPNLVEVYDITEGDRPPYYLEMEYVEGPPMAGWLAADPPLTERLEVIAQVADALDTAHAAGIYHRDIKPSNILLTHRADGTLQAKLSDFGLGAAEDTKLLESISVSRVEGVAGTWDYLAPEMREGGRASAQSDLYSLGITLYQLAVGDARRPLTADWESQLPSQILREDIRRCVASKPEDRWRSAAELSTALRSHDERLERLRLERASAAQRRRARRLRVILGIVGLFAAVMIGLGGYAWHQRGVARAQRDEAERQRRAAQHQRDQAVVARYVAERRLYLSSVLLADSQIGRQRYDLAAVSLWRAPERFRHWEWGYLVRVAHVELATLHRPGAWVFDAAFSPDGARIVTTSRDGTAAVWDAETGTATAALTGHTGSVRGAAFSPDSRRVVTASGDGTAKVWDAATGAERITLAGHTDRVYSARFSPDGTRIVTASADGTAKIWDAAKPRVLATLSGHKASVYDAAFSADGRRIITRSGDGTAKVWDAATASQLAALAAHKGNVTHAELSPEADRVVTASEDRTAKVWDAAGGAELVTLSGHGGTVFSARFSRDGRRIVTAGEDGTAKVWDAAAGSVLATLSEAGRKVYSAAFSPDAARVVTASQGGAVHVWELAARRVSARLCGHKQDVMLAAFSPDGARVVTVSQDGAAKLWDLATGPPFLTLARHASEISSVSFSPDAGRIATASFDKTARIWDAATGAELATLRGHEDVVWSAVFRPDAARLVTASEDNTAKVWNPATGALLRTLSGHKSWVFCATFSPDGACILTASADQTARVWDAATGKELLVIAVPGAAPATTRPASPGARGVEPSSGGITKIADARGEAAPAGQRKWPFSAAFSPDGRRIVTASGMAVSLWDAATAAELATLRGHRSPVRSAAFSPDGERIVTASEDHTAKVWNARTGALLATLAGHRGAVIVAAFGPAGKRIVTASADGTAKAWDAQTGTELAALAGHERTVVSAAFSPDGARIVTGSPDGTVKLWDAESGAELTTLPGQAAAGDALGRAGAALPTGFSPDGLRIVSALHDGTARVWAAAPFREEDLPGDDSMTWRQRLRLWQHEQYRLWIARRSRPVESLQVE